MCNLDTLEDFSSSSSFGTSREQTPQEKMKIEFNARFVARVSAG
jgi:hypothetical protein